MHKALYRTYRPQKFEDIIGQDHVVKTLKNQILENSLSHAYLFSGMRGTGKTSTAKIFSRAVNCMEEDKNLIPCNVCESCQAILHEANLDVIEIDAASNNSVEDVREIRESTKYTPAKFKYKVYIIDEVHMLSTSAFNALLKTLEEPPPYVIFILATTDPNKIPATILSRCQRYDFKNLTVTDIKNHLASICEKTDFTYDEEALAIIARNAQGALRDSLSILDQCMSFAQNNHIGYDDVVEVLGTANPDQIYDLCLAILNFDGDKALSIMDNFINWGKDIKTLIDDMIYFYRNMMVAKISKNPEELIYLPRYLIEKISADADNRALESIIRNINILSDLQGSLKNSTNPRISTEIAFIKMVQPNFDDRRDALVDRIEYLEKLVEDGNLLLCDNKIKADVGLNQENQFDPEVAYRDTLVNKIEKDSLKPFPGFDQIDKDASESLKDQLRELEKILRDLSSKSEKKVKDNFKQFSFIFDESTKVYVHKDRAYLAIDDEFKIGYEHAKESIDEYLLWINKVLKEELDFDYTLITCLQSDINDGLDSIESKEERLIKLLEQSNFNFHKE